MSQLSWKIKFPLLVVALSVVVGVTLLTLARIEASKKITEAAEKARPAELRIEILYDDKCLDCFSTDQFVSAIKQQNVNVIIEAQFARGTQEADALIAKYKITKIPAVVLRGEISKDEKFYQGLSQIGRIEENVFVLDNIPGIYIDLATGQTRGLVTLTLISDKSCANCHDVTGHLKVLPTYGVPVNGAKVVDRADSAGASLISKYGIKLLPTFVLEGDVDLYNALKQVWSQVGTVEKDGTLVFRDGVTSMGVYKDLSTGKIVEPPPQN